LIFLLKGIKIGLMSPRNTSTGNVLENMILPALERGGYSVKKQVAVGIRVGMKGKHKVDAVAEKGSEKFLISSKWQQTAGTAEQKVPYEVVCLVQAMVDNVGVFTKAYIILGGDGWSLRDFYVSGGLNRFIKDMDDVIIVSLERFVALANNGEL
jgi:hypothetical protein